MLQKLKFVALAAGLACAGAVHAETVVDVHAGLGVKYGPAYFGAKKMVAGPTGRLQVNELSFGKMAYDGRVEKTGFGLRGGFRFVGARRASDSPELAGLPDIDPALELGLGIGYEAKNWRAFADLRQGLGGHHGQVAELGADLKLPVSDKLTVTFGPRALYGSADYMNTYFNVSAASALTSSFAAYSGGAGLVSTGVSLKANYDISPVWRVTFGADYDVLRGDAAKSPIVQTDKQGSVSVVLSRALRIAF
ncbi:MipA/OmpV family protein [Pseudoprimorskyibacter insulae]|uniref:MltA-interacting protein n=1 Tax=Pseudoprimorskyibacter insulae TaxID=1695997 RepID=A0A2R8B078_9RHOB|nr:MipA/OmpV family protein [Pseudoprimorskyibacter insulae]SPF81668.1 hypothetical protein PRI8871_03493 [Pseudoprimorskyibacter insulae]